MNFKLFFVMLVGALFFAGCSNEIDDELSDNPLKAKLGTDNPAEKLVTRPFKSSASGDWFLSESTVCDELLQYSIVGNGNATHMGAITIEGTLCTFPPEGLYFITVTYTAANGDQVTWEAVDVFTNEEGLFEGGVFECLGGTGRFEGSEGMITVNELLIVTAFDEELGLPLGGTFTNNGSGTLAY